MNNKSECKRCGHLRENHEPDIEVAQPVGSTIKTIVYRCDKEGCNCISSDFDKKIIKINYKIL